MRGSSHIGPTARYVKKGQSRRAAGTQTGWVDHTSTQVLSTERLAAVDRPVCLHRQRPPSGDPCAVFAAHLASGIIRSFKRAAISPRGPAIHGPRQPRPVLACDVSKPGFSSIMRTVSPCRWVNGSQTTTMCASPSVCRTSESTAAPTQVMSPVPTRRSPLVKNVVVACCSARGNFRR